MAAIERALRAGQPSRSIPRANGDPASDYLITQLVFLPFESNITDANENSLRALLASSKDKGYEVRTALIGTPLACSTTARVRL